MKKTIINNNNIFYYDSNDNVTENLKRGILYGDKAYVTVNKFLLSNKNGWIIDCGASIGTFSFNPIIFEKKNVLLIEAAIKNIECLYSTFSIFSNALIENAIILDNIYSCDFNQDYGPFGHVKNLSCGSSLSTTIDNLCFKNKINNVSIIKYDIEGYEIEALLGSKQILKKYKPLLLLEINGHCLRLKNQKPYDVLHTIESLGYIPFFVRRNYDGLILIDKNEKFPFCVEDIICIHENNIQQYIDANLFLPPLNKTIINSIIQYNTLYANNECKQYFETLN